MTNTTKEATSKPITNRLVPKSLPSTFAGVYGATSSGVEIEVAEKIKSNEPTSGTSISERML